MTNVRKILIVDDDAAVATFWSNISPCTIESKQLRLRAEPKACRLQELARLISSSWM
jgi:hypothetical protein